MKLFYLNIIYHFNWKNFVKIEANYRIKWIKNVKLIKISVIINI